ncbi:arsenate reductase ArsC [Lewinella sp. LCG006]|uniref:arsenate reductase ArsC n=1 Tax=Lewinella sp. LCG006 TaxID=3231911 RepID=UPI00345F9941
MRKILVLCTGNACRSQMAEAYLRYFTRGKAEIFSAGLKPHQVHPLAVEVMLEDNIDMSFAQSKHLDEFSGQHFDYLITVCKKAEDCRPADITADHHFFYDIPNPEAVSQEDPLTVFLKVREEVKRRMLRFIGQRDEFHVLGESSLEY